MTDDISKVVPPVHAPTFVPSFSEAARCLGVAQAAGNRSAIAHWHHIVNAHEVAAEAALRLESATTLAAIDSAQVYSKAIDAAPTEGDGDTFDAISAEMREVVMGYDFDRDDDLSEWANRIDALAATLARQLAEAKAANEIAASVHEHERMNFQVQLAAATRRVAEVDSQDLRHLIVMDTQFAWSGETSLKLPEIQRLELRGWVAEGHENGEYEITDGGRAAIDAALGAAR